MFPIWDQAGKLGKGWSVRAFSLSSGFALDTRGLLVEPPEGLYP